MKMAEIAIETPENRPPKSFGHVLRKFISKQFKLIGIK
jgi:hypothetical protein